TPPASPPPLHDALPICDDRGRTVRIGALDDATSAARSPSDLGHEGEPPGRPQVFRWTLRQPLHDVWGEACQPRQERDLGDTFDRSEEHTSELQSRENLV